MLGLNGDGLWDLSGQKWSPYRYVLDTHGLAQILKNYPWGLAIEKVRLFGILGLLIEMAHGSTR